jgi:hypothetical protein
MKKLNLLFVIFIVACYNKKASIEGSYILTAGQYGDSILSEDDLERYRTIKVYSNGYWIATTFFGRNQTTVERASGGTYSLQNGICIETTDFSSEGEPDFGKTDEFKYKVQGAVLSQERVINKENCGTCLTKARYAKLPFDKNLLDTTLEGVWKIRESEWFGKKTVDPDLVHIKIYSNPRFAWASYHSEGKDFIGVGGGTYQFDGAKLVEHLEYFSYYDITPANEKIDVIRQTSTAIQLINVGSAGKEIYDKVQRTPGKN